jgi:hypothetical protein
LIETLAVVYGSPMAVSAQAHQIVLAEPHKRAGIYYATSADGVELPILDVAHPAFAVSLTGAELSALLTDYLREQRRWELIPTFLRRPLYEWLLRDSLLGDGMRQAEGGFLSGMSTYLFKLGPELLGSAYARPIDRRIVATLPGLAMRLRLSDMARMLAGAALPLLAEDTASPLCFINIAGGPAMDSINALLMLQREHPMLLAGRSLRIEVLDMVGAGPAFGQRALAALGAPGAPLHGLSITLRHTQYDWSQVATLARILAAARREGALTLGSSEGGLFEYGSDQAIVDNLCCLKVETGLGFAMIGSVTRNDEHLRKMHAFSRVATQPRGIETFRRLVDRSGLVLAQVAERPFSDHVLLTHPAA